MPTSARSVLANDFAAQWQEVREDALEAVDRVGRSGWLVLGSEVEAFERELAEWWGLGQAVGVASGLDAIEIALRIAGVRSGDRVVTTPLTAFATTLAILRAGAEPVWVDVDETGSLDLSAAVAVAEADPKIRAALPVHLYGHPLDPAGLAALADVREDFVVIEDCAQSAGAERDGRPTGATGALAATSLYPTKNLGAMGDGGVLLTDDGDAAQHARTLRNYGQDRRYHHVELGLNSRLDELHAAMLRSALLPRLDGWLARRAEVAARYVEGLTGTRLRPIAAAGGRSAHHLFAVELLDDAADADAVVATLSGGGVAAGRHYPFLCPDMPAVAGTGVTVGDLPVARRLAAREISLPMHPQLTDEDVDHVIDRCRLL